MNVRRLYRITDGCQKISVSAFLWFMSPSVNHLLMEIESEPKAVLPHRERVGGRQKPIRGLEMTFDLGLTLRGRGDLDGCPRCSLTPGVNRRHRWLHVRSSWGWWISSG